MNPFISTACRDDEMGMRGRVNLYVHIGLDANQIKKQKSNEHFGQLIFRNDLSNKWLNFVWLMADGHIFILAEHESNLISITNVACN